MAEKKSTSGKVGRPKKKYGTETLMNNKKSFKLDNTNVVVDKHADALIVAAIMLIAACICLYLFIK